ncbi:MULTISPECIES: ABC transporter ATP-binding protein [unclassified Methanoculleus]|jgi:putative ABC transport system ATP-binding protein|uniref:ABC transporter ATP-binding protein n=1 Tax=unclassified Methanoculleus TaxID=2619537 RepID=UPI0025E70CA4|nr:ABC transporter ATP-binding protein [Methanoculleus sp. UBA377]MDD2472409.1 ABC transporter ATP-binding protein [Methanoculleus sp.]
MSSPVIELDNVTKIYPLPAGDVTALKGISLTIDEGEFVAIMGPSGSGKSTLLNQIGCLDRPTSGNLLLSGKNTREMDDRELTSLRLSSIGYIFQKFNLIPLLSAYENVEYPYIMKHRKNDDTGRVRDLLSLVGIDESLSTHKPSELSGGQQQRIAIARALVNDPAILLCDEPTGNLDSQTSLQIMEILADLHNRGRTLVMVTHNPETATYADRTITIRDGRVA